MNAGAQDGGARAGKCDEGVCDFVYSGPETTQAQFLLKKLAELRTAEGHHARMISLTGFRTGQQANSFTAGKGHTEITIVEAIRMIPSDSFRRSVEATRLIAIGTNTVIQQRSDGAVRSEVYSGSDPTRLRFGFGEYSLLLFVPQRLPQPILPGETKSHLRLTFYVQGKHLPSEREALLVSQALGRASGSSHFQVTIRTDPWFLEELGPTWFPFAPDSPVPTPVAYSAAGSVYCTSNLLRPGLQCNSSRKSAAN